MAGHRGKRIGHKSDGRHGREMKSDNRQDEQHHGHEAAQQDRSPRRDMHRTRGELVAAAERAGLQVAAAGTHPFSSWIDQVISPGERYQHIVEELQQLARSLLIFSIGLSR